MGGLAMSDNNLTPRIEQLAPELEKIISTSEPIQHLADGFGGAQGPAEGPLWWEEGGYLLSSDIHNNRRMKYQPGSGVSLFLEPTNRANGLTRDLQGRLVACELRQHAARQQLEGPDVAATRVVAHRPGVRRSARAGTRRARWH